MPMIGPMIAGGILKGILVILTTMGILTNTDGTYLVLSDVCSSDLVLYADYRRIFMRKDF